jgi:hypothetical protein
MFAFGHPAGTIAQPGQSAKSDLQNPAADPAPAD